jgi:hypothetical protein
VFRNPKSFDPLTVPPVSQLGLNPARPKCPMNPHRAIVVASDSYVRVLKRVLRPIGVPLHSDFGCGTDFQVHLTNCLLPTAHCPLFLKRSQTGPDVFGGRL